MNQVGFLVRTVSVAVVMLSCIPSNTFAMGDKPPQDPSCFVNENIRLQVEDVTFSVPRKQVLGITYHPDSPHHMPSTSAKKLCQRPEGAAVPVEGFTFQMHPETERLLSAGKPDCAQIGMTMIIGSNSWNNRLKDIPDSFSLKAINEQCTSTRSHDSCHGGWRYHEFEMRLFYYPSCYPLEGWEETAESVIRNLDQLVMQEE